jgi:putative nucleotidyltransferase with HDIG domain
MNEIKIDRASALALMEKHISDEMLRHHSLMVAEAMAAYAKALKEDIDLWYVTGLLHDLDWQTHPQEHPFKAVNDWLKDYPQELKQAILTHAPGITKLKAQTLIERYLFACDEICGLMNAVALMRPNRFADMKVKSVTKKIKDKSFAANVSRKDIKEGFLLIDKQPAEHIEFLIKVFKNW